MSYEIKDLSITLVTNAELEDEQYYAVKMNSSGKVILASTGERMIGVLQDTPDAANRSCEVMVDGVTKAVGGDAIDAGAAVQVNSAGKFVTLTTGTCVGIALEACAADGNIFTMLIRQT